LWGLGLKAGELGFILVELGVTSVCLKGGHCTPRKFWGVGSVGWQLGELSVFSSSLSSRKADNYGGGTRVMAKGVSESRSLDMWMARL